jgi:anti-anti-sigma factor
MKRRLGSMTRLTVEPLSDGTLRLVGEVDMSNAVELEGAIAPLVRAGGEVRLECAALSFMDSTGFNVLLRAATRLRDRGTLVLLSPGPFIHQVLGALGLAQMPSVDIREGGSRPGSERSTADSTAPEED